MAQVSQYHIFPMSADAKEKILGSPQGRRSGEPDAGGVR